MMNRNTGLMGMFFIFIMAITSCSSYDKVKRSNDVNYKLTMANTYYDKGQYLQSKELYESLMPVLKGTKNFETVYYKYAMSNFKMKDYNSASYHFKNYASMYPNSVNTDEAKFLHAYSIYRLSPKVSVMQTNTQKALEVLQEFVNNNPNSKHIEEAKQYIDITKGKLEEKAAMSAKLYYDISQYKAASVVYRNVQNDFPRSKRMDEYQFMIVKSNYKYAIASIKDKQEERLINTLNAYHEFVDNYPESKYIKDAEKYYTLTNEQLQKIKK
jgi:outer membrane protein assembly factor BamD